MKRMKNNISVDHITLEEAAVKISQENERINDLIEEKGMKKTYIIEKSKIPKTTFFYKLRTKTFSAEELSTITRVLNPQNS